jgi:hypothetical protein
MYKGIYQFVKKLYFLGFFGFNTPTVAKITYLLQISTLFTKRAQTFIGVFCIRNNKKNNKI